MQIVTVTNSQLAVEFIELTTFIYANNTNWIRPLDKDINEVFDIKKNKAFRFGELERWILKDDKNTSIGRIAAFVNKKYKNKGDDVPVGGIGFFECIDNQDAAITLLNHAKNWLQQKGMQAMDGPINFGERDRWWGLVVKGFHEPLYGMNYNPPYYKNFFDSFGFKPFFNQICFGIDPKKPLQQKVYDRHASFANNPAFTSQHFEPNLLEKYAKDFATVYNKAWAGHGGLKQMPEAQAILLFKKMKRVMDKKIIWFAYHHQDPIAIFINLPDLNQWFKYLDGKFGWWQIIKFLWVKQFVPNKKFTGIVFGVVPEWQGKGVDAFIIGESANKYIQTNKSTYTEYEMQWIGEFNPKMINVAENLGDTTRSRILTTYRYNFDSSKPVVMHPML
jgi:hypothetical protein